MTKRGKQILVGAILLLLFAGHSLAFRHYLVGDSPSANDFYSRWAGGRALLVESRDPYDLSVTREIQPVIGVDPEEEVGRGGFHYPLHVLFLFFPLPYLSYPWAQAIWQTALVWVVIGVVLLLARTYQGESSPWGILGILFAGLFFYPATRSIFLGQFTLHVTLFVALTLWAWRNGRYGWAGIFFAFTSIKPQMIVLPGIWFALWAIWRRRWRFLGGLLGGGLTLLLGSMLLFPRWPVSFLLDVQRYAGVAGGRNPLSVLGSYLWGDVDLIRYLLSALILAGMALAWRQAIQRHNETDFEWGLWWAIAANLLVPFQTGTTNQALLLVVFIPWVYTAVQHWGTVKTAVLVFIVEAGVWTLFFNTLSGNYENPLLFIPLPLLTLLTLLGREWKRRRGKEIRVGET